MDPSPEGSRLDADHPKSGVLIPCRSTLVKAYQSIVSKLAEWLGKNAPEGLAVFSLPETHRRRMRTSNPMERAVQQEINRRT